MHGWANFLGGLACVGMVWGLLWGMVLPNWLWLFAVSMVVGVACCFFIED